MKNILLSISFLLIVNNAGAQFVKSSGLYGNYGLTQFKNSKDFATENAFGIKVNFQISKKTELSIIPYINVQDEYKERYFPDCMTGEPKNGYLFTTKKRGVGLNLQYRYNLKTINKFTMYVNPGMTVNLSTLQTVKTEADGRVSVTNFEYNTKTKFSSNALFGFGFQYKISKKINLELEPTINCNTLNNYSIQKKAIGFLIATSVNYYF
jgi:opacity protein-like surface antigen